MGRALLNLFLTERNNTKFGNKWQFLKVTFVRLTLLSKAANKRSLQWSDVNNESFLDNFLSTWSSELLHLQGRYKSTGGLACLAISLPRSDFSPFKRVYTSLGASERQTCLCKAIYLEAISGSFPVKKMCITYFSLISWKNFWLLFLICVLK